MGAIYEDSILNENYIPIFMCTDDNYAIPTYMSIYSLMYNYKGNLNINLYILTSTGLMEKNQKLINSLSKKFHCMNIQIVNVGNAYDSVDINVSYITTATLFRLLIPRIAREFGIQAKKCIYLDSDIVVEGDITEMFNIDVTDYCVAGVREMPITGSNAIEKKKSLEIDDLDNYINAGVLLLNLEEIENQKLGKRLEEAGNRGDFTHNDQDAINSVFYGKIKPIPIRFNAISAYLYWNNKTTIKQYGIENLTVAVRNPIVIHYVLKKKPWTNKSLILARRWWKYINKQDKEIMNEYIKPFLDEHKAPFNERFCELIHTMLVCSGISPSLVKIKQSLLGIVR